MPMGLELADVKEYLGYAEDDTSRDAQLQVILDAAFANVKSLLGRNLERGIYMDIFQAQAQKVYVRESPVEEFTTVAIGSSLIDPGEYMEFKPNGLLFFKNFTNYWRHIDLPEASLLQVTYVGGYTTLPADIRLAMLTAIQTVDTAQKQLSTSGGVVKRVSVYDVGVTDYMTPLAGTDTSLRNNLASGLGHYMSSDAMLAGWMLKESLYIGAPSP